MILLDTDVCVALLRGVPQVLEQRLRARARVATTAITAGELRYGAAKSAAPERHHREVSLFLSSLPVLDLTPRASIHFGTLKAALERSGERLDDADLWIASLALQHATTLATGNLRPYNRVPNLRLENWMWKR